MEDQTQLFETFIAAVGEPLLDYILNASVVELRSGVKSLTPRQAAVVAVLRQVVELRLPYEAERPNLRNVLKAVLCQPDDDGITVARHLHAQAGGIDPPIQGQDQLERSIIALAVDAFPAFLLPPDDEFPAPRVGSGIYVTALVFRHPQRYVFQEALVCDETIGPKFSREEGPVGPRTMVWRNVGSGGDLQAAMVPEFVLGGAWRRIKRDRPTPEVFVEGATSQLRLVLDLLRGSVKPITAKFALAGVLLPDDVERVELPDASLESVTTADRELSPESLRQQLTGTDSSGNTTVINYDGDIILRLDFPLKVRAMLPVPPAERPIMWPDDMRIPEAVDRSVERLRFSLILGVDRHPRVQLVPTWRYFDDPFGYGLVTTWFDPRNAAGLVPTRLTNSELESWVEWYGLLSNPHLDKIGLAVTRILRAVGERREATDVLVDAVIAWENMFGTSEGEPTLRVTASLALLLEDNLAERKKLRARLRDIYTLRSGVVHGSKSLKEADFPLCQEALDVAIAAVRILARDRADVLSLTDGAA